MAVNSFGSVSLNPALVLFCPAASSRSWPLIRTVGRFCVNILAADHAPIVAQLSRRGGDRFADLELVTRSGGPGLADALAWIDCTTEEEHLAGDHTIVVARVDSVEVAPEGAPLVFFRGGYGTFVSPPEADGDRPTTGRR